MTDHYYSNKPEVKSEPKSWNFTLKGRTFRFTSDRGVFSRDEVDFGSRHLIETFTEPSVEGEILDVGCGYGPIGIALAATYSERKVVMIDVNERAVDLARMNAKHNSIDNVEVIQSDLFENVDGMAFAAILTNPPIRAGKKVVHHIFEQAYEHLIPGGELWVVIQKKQGAPSAMEKMKELSFEVNVEAKEKGYYIIKAKKC